MCCVCFFFFFQAEDGIRDLTVTGVQTCALPILERDQAPDTVHPALWRQAQRNRVSGLFQVTDRLYQVRGLDLSNMSIIEGETGLIVVDPLMYTETAQAAMDLYFQHRPRKPVVAVVYSHSHVDHFGGVRGVVRQEEVDAGRVQVIAPAGFMAEAVGENVIAGHAMGRRALYQFGMLLPRDARGQVDAGLGKAGAPGTMGLIAPTRVIDKPRETLRIDGVDIEFALTPGAEAPAEMIMYYPQLKVLNMAEIAVHTQHNLLPLRGAQDRKSTRLNSSHSQISYAVFCLKKKNNHHKYMIYSHTMS